MRGLPHAELLRLLSRLPILILSVPIISSFVAPINYLISAILSISLVGRSRILDSDRREGVVRRGAAGEAWRKRARQVDPDTGHRVAGLLQSRAADICDWVGKKNCACPGAWSKLGGG